MLQYNQSTLSGPRGLTVGKILVVHISNPTIGNFKKNYFLSTFYLIGMTKSTRPELSVIIKLVNTVLLDLDM